MSDIINMGMSFLSFLRYPDSIRYSRHVLTTKPYIQKSKIFEHLYVVNCKNVHLKFQKNFLEIRLFFFGEVSGEKPKSLIAPEKAGDHWRPLDGRPFCKFPIVVGPGLGLRLGRLIFQIAECIKRFCF